MYLQATSSKVATAHDEVQESALLLAAVGRLWCVDRLRFGKQQDVDGSGAVLSQTAAPYTDSENGFVFEGVTDPVYKVTYGIVLPSASTSTEFIGEIVAPAAAKWIGLALGGAMIGDLLIMAWPNGNKIVSSTRYATYVLSVPVVTMVC